MDGSHAPAGQECLHLKLALQSSHAGVAAGAGMSTQTGQAGCSKQGAKRTRHPAPPRAKLARQLLCPGPAVQVPRRVPLPPPATQRRLKKTNKQKTSLPGQPGTLPAPAHPPVSRWLSSTRPAAQTKPPCMHCTPAHSTPPGAARGRRRCGNKVGHSRASRAKACGCVDKLQHSRQLLASCSWQPLQHEQCTHSTPARTNIKPYRQGSPATFGPSRIHQSSCP